MDLCGYHLDLEFASDESFLGLSAGDPEAVTYSAHENVLTLRPKAASSSDEPDGLDRLSTVTISNTPLHRIRRAASPMK